MPLELLPTLIPTPNHLGSFPVSCLPLQYVSNSFCLLSLPLNSEQDDARQAASERPVCAWDNHVLASIAGQGTTR